MSKKILTATIITIIVCSAMLIQQVSSDTISQPSKLSLSINPPSIPADNNVYNCIFVLLQDANGNPARAQQDTIISLSSSLVEIGTVDSTIIIQAGHTFGAANFYTTYTPGATTITAAGTGYPTVQAVVNTVGPKPYTLGVYGFPATLPADGRAYDAIMVQLQDSAKSPAKAPIGGTKVTLSCSNTDVGDVTQSVTIAEGKTFAIATFTTTTSPGEANITAIASDYGSTITKINTQTPTITGSGNLHISSGPTKVLSDNTAYKRIAVQILDGTNRYLQTASSDITVTIASADESIGKTEAQITIPAGENYALATFNSTYKAGTTTITAAATNFNAASYSLTSTGFTASKLAVYCAPSTLPADKKEYQSVIVQLQDSQGRPAQAPANLAVSLFSSQPVIATVTPTVTVPLGQTSATGSLTVTNAPGPTVVTAQASNYNTGQATATTHSIDLTRLEVTLTANPQTVFNSNQTEITAHITADDSAIAGATIKFTSNNNGTFSQTREDEAGYYKTTFTAASFQHATTCTITVNASKSGYLSTLATVQVTVNPPSSGNTNPTTNSSSSASNPVSTAQLLFKIIDSKGNFVSGAQVTSVSQPTGVSALSAISNETGYVTFPNMNGGSYSFQVTKEGYQALVQPLEFNGSKMQFALTLTANAQSGNDSILSIVAAIVVAIVIVIVVIVVIKRRKTTKTKSSAPLKWPPE
ncbi:MAG TPA: carboxypeptidase-like regulatory domain-containing protein [Candidatus Acidoferrales bacterium]|nr:carboxypeptidase-like regulatory domain-containing protein [Candidatus Acidoferrales bacterium]